MSLFSNGKVVASAVSTADGSFQILTGVEGRFFLVVSAKSFRQLQTPDFYAGQFDSVERKIVLEPEWVHESIVVTATGTPTPQPQTSAATTVLDQQDLALADDMVSALRLMPGVSVVQSGERGGRLRCSFVEAIPTTTRSCLTAWTWATSAISLILAPFLPPWLKARKCIAAPTRTCLAREQWPVSSVSLRRTEPPVSHPSRLRATPAASIHQARRSRWRARTTSSIIWAPSTGCKLLIPFPMTSITWARARQTLAGNPLAIQ